MAELKFRGFIAPVFTPLKDDLSLNLEIIPEYARFLSNSSIPGVLVNGTSGEGMSLDVEERKILAEEWGKAIVNTKQHLMVQVGGAPLPDVLKLAKHANQINVGSMLCLPDLYNKPKTPEELVHYLNLISAVAPNVPLLYYHIPSYTNVNINMGFFLEKYANQIPTFRGIKFTSTALDEGVEALKAVHGKYAVFLGADQLLAPAFALGFDSAIATTFNMVPYFGTEINRNIQASKIKRARDMQEVLTKFCALVTKNGGWVPTMKAAMSLLTPHKVGLAKDPLVNLTEFELNMLQEDLRGLNLLE